MSLVHPPSVSMVFGFTRHGLGVANNLDPAFPSPHIDALNILVDLHEPQGDAVALPHVSTFQYALTILV
jgi:hypothetical protein